MAHTVDGMHESDPVTLLTLADLSRRYQVGASAVSTWHRRYGWRSPVTPVRTPLGRRGMRMPRPVAQTTGGAPLYGCEQLPALDEFAAVMSSHPLSTARVPVGDGGVAGSAREGQRPNDTTTGTCGRSTTA